MSLSVNWITKVITVPQLYLTHVGGDVYKLDVNQFRLDLKSIEDSEEGMVFLDTHRHNTQVDVSGVTLARVVEIINGYTITFEEGMYIVNLVGANNNIMDVTNLNYVSIRSTNSAGLQISQEAWSQSEKDQVIQDVVDASQVLKARWRIDKTTSLMYVYSSEDSVPLVTFKLLDENGNLVNFNNPDVKVFERRPI